MAGKDILHLGTLYVKRDFAAVTNGAPFYQGMLCTRIRILNIWKRGRSQKEERDDRVKFEGRRKEDKYCQKHTHTG